MGGRRRERTTIKSSSSVAAGRGPSSCLIVASWSVFISTGKGELASTTISVTRITELLLKETERGIARVARSGHSAAAQRFLFSLPRACSSSEDELTVNESDSGGERCCATSSTIVSHCAASSDGNCWAWASSTSNSKSK